MTKRPLGDFDAYLFDADGTLIYPQQAVPGAPEAVAALKQAGKRVLVVTNNSRNSRAEMAAKLRSAGIPIAEDDVLTALVATAQHVARERPGAQVYVIGAESLQSELRAHGLAVVAGGPVDYVVVGADLHLTYEKLTVAMRALLGGARFVAVNVDRFIPDPAGLLPGTALTVGGLQAVTDRAPDVVVGKPSTVLLEEAIARVGLPPAACLFIGDSLDSDVRAAQAVGMPALLMLSGVTTREDLVHPPVQPDYVLESLADLIPHLKVSRRP